MDSSTLGAAIALIKKNKPTAEQIGAAVDNYIEEHPEAIAATKFNVTFTAQMDPQTGIVDRTNVTCDKTIEQILDAYNANKTVVGFYVIGADGFPLSMSIELGFSMIEIKQGSMSQQIPLFIGEMAIEGPTVITITPSGTGEWDVEVSVRMMGTANDDLNNYFDSLGFTIRRVANPINATDAANKSYVDNAVKVSVVSPASGTTFTLDPYPKTYAFGEKAELTVTVTATSQYHFSFSSPSATATVLTMTGITGTMGDTVEAGKDYEVDIWAGTALIKEVEVTPVT